VTLSASDYGDFTRIMVLYKLHCLLTYLLTYYYTQIPYILPPVGAAVLTNKTSKYKEFIVTCNTIKITLGH